MADPIDLDKLSVSLAASMISAQRYLLQANQDLDDLYQGNPHLADMPRPRYSLGTVTFDIPYVVESVQSPEAPAIAETRVGKDVELSPTELASLKRGASEQTLQQLDSLVSDYTAVKSGLREALKIGTAAPKSTITNPVPLKRLASPVELGRTHLTELGTGASKIAVSKLTRLLEDYESARSSYVRVKETLSGGSLPRLAVRIDPESIAVSPQSVHRMSLQFNAEDQAPVKVQGQTLS